jgi:hypothetical protein
MGNLNVAALSCLIRHVTMRQATTGADSDREELHIAEYE